MTRFDEAGLIWPQPAGLQGSRRFSPAGFMVVASLPDEHFRIVAMVDQAPESPSRELLQSLLDQRGPRQNPRRIKNVAWSSRLRIHHRLAEIENR